MPDFDTVVYNPLKRHNTKKLRFSMYKIDEKYVSFVLVCCTRGRCLIHNFKIYSHGMILNIKLTECPMFLTFVSLM